ncbi:late embryogenesis abundant protein At1g64065-like [Punica granatum]|uniref:Uncharacterized protein n=2 Tax=Punica granatum TaxID=22663 RepID=A0A218XLS6_PUNGR|nr:late embryogenesis abundant protein At1g64065-like [Punica granatum]OWM85272.1 hypothetical protein CDL15_Pgr028059 [Punica granatum]PKI46276.1 hypothetical protein CRG98_033328 [Punica granatum]
MSPEHPPKGRHLVPSGVHLPRGPEYSPTYTTPLKPERRWSRYHRTSSRLVVYLFALFVLFCAALLAFALIVRPKAPRFRMSEVRIKSLTYSYNNNNNNNSMQLGGLSSSAASLNATLVAVITVSNPNFGRFDHEKATVRVVYGGALFVGEKAVRPGRAGARGTERLELEIEVGKTSGQALDESNSVAGNFTRDVGSGLVKLRSYGRLSGRVYYLMGSEKVKKRKTADMNCEMKLNLTSRLVQDLACQ